ncbi:MAG: hypothetical protein LBN36_04385 [Clostridiales Family XIII bacterium]|jgi:hypothetical protein|nr:hypothetical protein [Clostridiales Family XIII bacterium]
MAAKTNQLNAEKKKRGLAARSLRERVMIYALIVIIIAAALVYFLVIPGSRNLQTLQAEVDSLREQEATTRSLIAQIEPNNDRYNAAKVLFEQAKLRYYLPMAPETIDEKITGILVDCGFSPDTLSMSQLTEEDVFPFTPQILSATALTDPSSAYTIPADINGSAGTKAYVYTVDVSASGEYKNFYALLEYINSKDGIEMVQFDYTEVFPEKPEAGKPAPPASASLDHVRMVIKIYVYVEGALLTPTVDLNASGEGATENSENPGPADTGNTEG